MTESEFVVTLSLHRDWFSPAQAKRVLDMALSEGLVETEDESVRARFDPGAVELPADFVPGDDLLQTRSTFEQMLDRLVDAGHEKRTAVAEINGIQRNLLVTIDAAAAIYAAKHDVDLDPLLERASQELRERVATEGPNE